MSKLLKALVGGLTMAVLPFVSNAGVDKEPVVFWGHYMPQVPLIYTDFGTDSFPFISAEGDAVVQYERHIVSALDSGVNGFQMLVWPDERMYQAAKNVYARTGRMIYVNPQWCDQKGGFDKVVEQMGNFAVAHKDDPHVFRIDGKQVHFFYGGRNWSGENDELLPKAKELIKARGVEVLFMPESTKTDKFLLDRPELGYGNWPFMKRPEPGPSKWLAQSKWDGIVSWGPGDTPYTLAEMMMERLKKGPNKDFVYMPEIWPGYDSVNRPNQNIHCQHYGVKVLHDNLRMWVEFGLRQFSVVTWNDMNETLLLPSTRSPFGFAEILKYYHQLATDGASPFESPKTVVAYDPEVMYGDELYFQFLNIPEKGAITSDYIYHVRLEDVNGVEVASVAARSTVQDERHDSLVEARLDTTQFANRVEILSPVVDVYRADRVGNERKLVHENLRLPPVILRYNKIQFFTSYVIALDRIAPDGAITLEGAKGSSRTINAVTGELLPLKATVKGDEGLRRLTLAESRLACGAFRADDAVKEMPEGKLRAFIRLRSERNFEFNLKISEGGVLERYAIHWNSLMVLKKYAQGDCVSAAFPYKDPKDTSSRMSLQDMNGVPTFRVDASKDSVISVISKTDGKPVIETTLSRLAAGPVTVSADIGGSPAAVRLEMTMDCCEPNFDYPLPQSGEYLRFVPVDANHDATRYFHAWALTASDRVAYSRPVEVIRVPSVDGSKSNFLGSILKGSVRKTVVDSQNAEIPCQFIRSFGVFDDFVDSSSSCARNPFTSRNVIETRLPARLIPYYLFDFEEGSGSLLNDSGTNHQCGRAWLSDSGCEWIKDGWSGSAIKLKGGVISLRGKSWPHGSYTFSARIRLGEKSKSDASLAGDGDYWNGIVTEGLRIDILPDGGVKASRNIRECEGSATSSLHLGKGWNHLVVTHDLNSIKIYINGKLGGEGAVGKPGYLRTHSTPTIGFSNVAKKLAAKDAPSPSFDGDLDQIEIIGTALGSDDVVKLYDCGQWMAR